MQDLSRFEKKSHIEIQTKYLSVLMGFSIALVGLVFALGVLVGSRSAKDPNCAEVDALSVLDSRSEEPAPPSPIAAPDLSFHKSLVEAPPKVPTPASLIGDDKPLDSKGAAPELKDISAVRPRMQEPPIPESVPSNEPGIYSLQVGSFKEKTDAVTMLDKLKQAGYGAFLVSVEMPDRGGLWYRVRVGPFDSQKEVLEKKRVFEEKERIPAFVVKRRAG